MKEIPVAWIGSPQGPQGDSREERPRALEEEQQGCQLWAGAWSKIPVDTSGALPNPLGSLFPSLQSTPKGLHSQWAAVPGESHPTGYLLPMTDWRATDKSPVPWSQVGTNSDAQLTFSVPCGIRMRPPSSELCLRSHCCLAFSPSMSCVSQPLIGFTREHFSVNSLYPNPHLKVCF